MTDLDRRDFMKFMGAAGASTALGAFGWSPSAHAKATARVVVVGGGFGGATCANYLRRWGPELDVTLVERNEHYITCPFSNAVIAGDIEMADITHGYDELAGTRGVKVLHGEATDIDPVGKKVMLGDGASLAYDMLVVSPGISFRWGQVENDEEAAAEAMPHAWIPGRQTMLLRNQLEAMDDGGTVLILPPLRPFRCPPGPYERASLIAHYLKNNKPKSKLLIVDANESHSKKDAFHEAWKKEYGDMVTWIKGTDGGNPIRVDPGTMTVESEFGETYKGDVINLIPHQQAGSIAFRAGLVADFGWCYVDQGTFESTNHKDVFVIGDSCVAGAMPKSGHSAASQAKVVASVIVSRSAGDEPPAPTYANTCYSLINPDYGISVAAVYRLQEGEIKRVAGGVTKVGESDRYHAKEARYAKAWYKSITGDAFS